ncbi:MAG: CPBP family intramembrane metalloprotease [Bacteroidetes bacterium]|nr:CPBP family intramembrane metalloprotease [Bacteroidota bacterium]HET6245619.1 CPBP family intramembrane glutamic endopeptidase [Bacteroidia bacterium]
MNKTVLLLGFGTVLIFGLSGIFVIEYFQQKDFVSLLLKGWNIPLQLLTGILFGFMIAEIAWFIINRDFFIKERAFYKGLISKLNLNFTQILFISFCAGIGEEIFFRAAIQPFLGILLTSVIFVALHGYLNPINWRISIYGSFMVLTMVGFGYLFKYTGLFTVMAAHTVFDIVLLKKLGNNKETVESTNT